MDAGVSSRTVFSLGASMSSGDEIGDMGEVDGSSGEEVSTMS